MGFASGSRHGLRYIREDDFGIVPDSPVMERVRLTSCSLVLNKDSFQSNEIRADAQIADLRHGVKQAAGDIGFELSYGAFDDFLAAAVRGEWDNDILVAGTTTPTFTFERVFNDIGQYQTFTGCAVNTLALQIQSNAMITGTLGIVGKGSEFTDTPTAKGEEPAPSHSPLDGFHGELKEGGIPISVITSISLNIDNGIQPANVLSSDEAAALIPGRINVTGSVSAYFEDLELLNKFVREIESEIEITLGNGGPGSYRIKLPRIKYSGGTNPVDGEGVIMLDMPFQALLDECTGTNIIIERIPVPEAAAQLCELVWSNTGFTESARNDGSITESILVSLTGGKEFAGRDGAPLPGIAFLDLPDGLRGTATRVTATNCKIELSGRATANDAADSLEFSIRFPAAAFKKGFCNCLNSEVVNAEQKVSITFADGDPLPVDARLTSIGVVDSKEELSSQADGLYVIHP